MFEDIENLEVQVAEQEEAEMRNYPEFEEEDEDEEEEDGEDETFFQPGETSKPRRKGVYLLRLGHTIYSYCDQGETERIQPFGDLAYLLAKEALTSTQVSHLFVVVGPPYEANHRECPFVP